MALILFHSQMQLVGKQCLVQGSPSGRASSSYGGNCENAYSPPHDWGRGALAPGWEKGASFPRGEVMIYIYIYIY